MSAIRQGDNVGSERNAMLFAVLRVFSGNCPPSSLRLLISLRELSGIVAVVYGDVSFARELARLRERERRVFTKHVPALPAPESVPDGELLPPARQYRDDDPTH